MAYGRDKKMKERLLKERETLLHERDALENQIKGLERAIALFPDEGAKLANGKKQPIKALVLELLEDVGTTGLNAATAVNMASTRSTPLERASVSSLLSRLKGDGIIEFDGSMYRLPKFAKAVAEEDDLVIFPDT